MSEFLESINVLYTNFVLRDLFAKIVPGMIVIVAIAVVTVIPVEGLVEGIKTSHFSFGCSCWASRGSEGSLCRAWANEPVYTGPTLQENTNRNWNSTRVFEISVVQRA